MGIYINGMEMPTKGYRLILVHADGTVQTTDGETTAVPVPPHGIIDREQILNAIRLELAQANAVNDMDDYDEWMRVFDYVRKFPTIIPAELKKEKT